MGTGTGAPTKRPSYVGDVVRKLKSLPEFQELTEDQLFERASELTDPEKLWSVYFSGVALDPAREYLERNLEAGTGSEGSGESLEALRPSSKIPIRLKLQPVQITSRHQFGFESFTSLLLDHYGSLHATIVLDSKVKLTWNTAGLIVPTYVHIEDTPHPNGSADASECSVTEEVMQYSFSSASSRKELMDKIAGIITRYNKNYIYHPVFRGCQKFVADCMSVLGYAPHPQLENKLGDYYNEVKKGRRKKIELDSHEQLDAYVGRVLDSGGSTPLETEFLLSQYFLVHVTSMTECEKPERWVCKSHAQCLMSRLEATLDVKDTIAYKMFRSSHEQAR